MDQELVAHLGRMSQQIVEGVRGEMRQQIEGLRGEMTQQMDGLRGEMTQQMDGLRGEMTQQMDGLRLEMSRKMDGLREELRDENRQTRVVMEGLRSDLQLLAEGVIGNGEKFMVHESATSRELEEMKATLAPYYRDLNVRVTRLEEWADRQGRDVLDVIREKHGKRQA